MSEVVLYGLKERKNKGGVTFFLTKEILSFFLTERELHLFRIFESDVLCEIFGSPKQEQKVVYFHSYVWTVERGVS